MERPAVKGLCSTMCPEAEITLRERENLLHPFETVTGLKCGRPIADYTKCVKEYRRPTVGKQEVDVYDLRPPEVLVATVNYLIDSIAARGNPWNEIYDFIFDRLRSVRQDLVIQDLHGKATIQILEKAVRFHVLSDYRLSTEHISLFDPKINDQHIQECLKRLINCYEKQKGKSQRRNGTGRSSPTGSENNQNGCLKTRAEFEATYLLFNLGEADALKHFYSLDKKIRNQPILKIAYEISMAYVLHNWVRVFKLVRKLTLPVHLCAVTRHFPELQRRALYSYNIGFSSKNSRFPLDKLRQLLLLNTDTDSQKLCEEHGLQVTGTNVNFFKTSFVNQDKFSRTHCDYITHRLRDWSTPDILHGHTEKTGPVLQQTDCDSLVSDLTEKCLI